MKKYLSIPSPVPIAIIGAACRLPGEITNLTDFWNLLHSRGDAVSELPPDRFSLERYFSLSKSFEGHCSTRAAGVLSNIFNFDPDFFNISRKEAQYMDPQQRLALELVWEAMEQAHVLPSSLRGSQTGVYMGASGIDASMRGCDDPAILSPYSMTGNALSIIANRISYIFDLQGPSLTVDTACSSSLVALHLACEDLRSGRTDMALAGGVNILMAPYPFIGFSRARMLSPDGRCKVFDASGNGYVRSEGGGMVLLKPLPLAVRDNNTILGIVAGSGINADGRTTGIAQPSGESQAELIRRTYARFHLNTRNVVYVEAHGTGTAAGDPTEAAAVGRELGMTLQGERPLLIGSVKSNLGHLEPASGMAGILKALLILRHNIIPPNLHFSVPNPAIDFAGLNISVPQINTRLPQAGGEELISVNSFGFGGANAHVVLQRAPEVKKKRAPSTRSLALPPLFLSAKSESSLRMLAADYASLLEEGRPEFCYDVAASLAFEREFLPVRAVVEGKNVQELCAELHALAKSDSEDKKRALPDPAGQGVFVFSGNGSQWCGMGSRLAETNAVFRESLEEVDSLLAPLQNWSIMDVFRDPQRHEEAFSLTKKSQPLLFALQVGLVRALEAKGVYASGVMGHSVGEVAAAWAAGALSLKDAAQVIYFRSLLQEPLRNTGGMAVANLPEAEARRILKDFDGFIDIAGINAPNSLTLAGQEDTLREFVNQCKKRHIVAKMLDIPYPFHTRAMNRVEEELVGSLAGIRPHIPRLPFFSTVDGKVLQSPPNGRYWFKNVRKPVLFGQAMQTAYAQGFRLFLEIGPAPILRSYINEASRNAPESCFVGATLRNKQDDAVEFAKAWKNAWQSGWNLERKKFFPQAYTRRALPLYPWNKEFVQVQSSPEERGFLHAPRLHPLLGWALPSNPAVFENTLLPADFPWLADHVAGNSAVYPAAAFLETMLAAAAVLHPDSPLELERVALFRPLPLTDNAPKCLRVSVDREDGGLLVEARSHMSAEPWGSYARCRILPLKTEAGPRGFSVENPESFGMAVEKKHLYETADRFLLHYGPAFRTVERAWVRSEVQCPEVLTALDDPVSASAEGMLIPPTLTDGAMQSLFILLGAHNKGLTRAYLPVAFERITLYAAGRPCFAHARLERISPRSAVASFQLLDSAGEVLLQLQHCRFRRALWLEHEHVASKPYTVKFLPSPHPNTVSPLEGISPAALVCDADARIAHALSPMIQDSRLAVHPSLLLQLAALSAAHESVLSLCGNSGQGLYCSTRELADAGILDPAHAFWFNAMLERLEQSNLAGRAHDRWYVQPRGERIKAGTLWRTLVSTSPEQLPEATLLAHVFNNHRNILSGQYSEQENARPSSRLIHNYFTHSPALRPVTLAALRCVESVLRAGKSGQAIAVLQIAHDPAAFLPDMLPLLSNAACRYVVAEQDESSAEIHSQQFALTPGLVFQSLDLEEPAPEHNGAYHCIFLAHALHAHHNEAQLLKACRKMLAPGGILCLLEHEPSAFTDYVLGSSPSWWRASPQEDTPVSLLRSASYWKTSLLQAGFTDVAVSDDSGDSFCPAFLLVAAASADAQAQEEQSASFAATAQIAAIEPPPSHYWLILTGSKDEPSASLGQGLLAELHQQGHKAALLDCADFYTDTAWEDTVAQWQNALQIHAEQADQDVLRVLFLAGYDNRNDLELELLYAAQEKSTFALAALSQAWDSLRFPLRLWVIGGGAFAQGVKTKPVPSQGALSGFTRVLKNELPGLHAIFLDIHGDDAESLAMLPHLVQELTSPSGEPEIIFSGKLRYVPRVMGVSPKSVRGPQSASPIVELNFDSPGRLQNLYWKRAALPEPKADEVCIEVRYTGLNFRDVLWSMGMLPDEALENGFSGPGMGMECSGIIHSMGSAVTGRQVGEPVVCFTPAGFSSHVVTKASAVAAKPGLLSFAESATIPVAFTTAWYALKHLARMQPGESVLIHGAAGGVGLAAVQIAAHLNLKVYATAGAPEKHSFLRQLGVKHLFSSRSLAFADQILRETDGRGVDAVLNCLAGEAIPAGLSVLRPFGRFLELGKRDFYADSPMRLRPFANNISYFGIDVDQLLLHQAPLARTLFNELLELFEQRKLVPLPYTLYQATRAVEAFQTMQQSSHIGKLVVSLEGAANVAKAPELVQRQIQLKANATYLITGGCAGLGLASAMRFALRGAKHLLLLSRSGAQDEQARKQLERMRANGVRIVEAKADVSDFTQLEACLKQHLAGLPPLRGIVHAAAVLDDALITQLTPERIRAVYAAKGLGAFNLHRITQALPLDFFVLYSSASVPFGNPGQANYVAANSMLEALGAWRRSQGLSAQVIGWGPIADTGMVTRNPKAKELLLKILGITPTTSKDALYWLEHCIAHDIGLSYYFGLDWQSRANLPALNSPRFSSLRPPSGASQDKKEFSLEKIRSLNAKEGSELLTAILIEEISHVLRLPKNRLAPDSPLVAQGMDSLMAVELAVALEQKFELTGYNLSLTEKTSPQTLAESFYLFLKGESASTSQENTQSLVQTLEHKHGVQLSEQERTTVLRKL